MSNPNRPSTLDYMSEDDYLDLLGVGSWDKMAEEADEEKKQREAEESKTEEMSDEEYKRLLQGQGGLLSDDPENPIFYDGIHTH